MTTHVRSPVLTSMKRHEVASTLIHRCITPYARWARNKRSFNNVS